MKITVVGKIPLPEEIKHTKPNPKKQPTTLNVTIERGKDGKAVGRLPSNKIALIHFNNDKILSPGEIWKCILISEEETKAIVLPESRVSTSIEAMADSLEKLKSQGLSFKSQVKTSYHSRK